MSYSRNLWGAVALTIVGSVAVAQTTTITESGTSSAYNSGFVSNPSPNPPGFTSSWNELNNSGGAGRFMDSGGAAVGSGRSWGIFSASGNYAIGRSLTHSAAIGSISFLMRHNVDNAAGFTGFNLKTSSSPTFGMNEILSVGLTPAGGNNAVRYNNTSTTTSLNFGQELRGAAMTYTAAWNTMSGTFSLSASRNGAAALNAAGSLPTGSSVVSFGFGNFNTGSGQNVLWNDLSISIPEPALLKSTFPTVGTNQATFDVSVGQPQSASISPTNKGYFTVQNVDSGFTTTFPQFAFAVAPAQLSNVVALLNTRATPNGYTVTTTPPAWVSGLPDSSAFNVFLRYATPSTGANHAYWDFSSLSGATVSAVAVVPEPSAITLAAGLATITRRRFAR